MNFKNKTAIVTGAALGIGRATAFKLAEYGANLALIDINKENLDKLNNELKKYNINFKTYLCDISNQTQVYNTVDKIIDNFGKIDILINNAALFRTYKPFLELGIDEWEQYINVNIMGAVYFTKKVLPVMLKNNYGRIINVASVAGVYGNANMVHYSATKGALIAMSKALAKEVVKNGITINSVSPGSVSPSEESDPNYHQPSDLPHIGRTGTDIENANLLCFLASEEASYISGQNIQIDGCRRLI